eukprot:2429312-Rhodomonas_salina.1
MSDDDQDVVNRMDENRLKARVLEASVLLLQNWFRFKRANKAAVIAAQLAQTQPRQTIRHSLTRRNSGGTMFAGGTPQEQYNISPERHTELLKNFYLCTERLR